MNPADPRHPWQRLTAAARRAEVEPETAAPYGFSTRVAALALTPERPVVSLFERWAPRALAFAGLLALGSVAFSYSAISVASPEEDLDLVLFSGDPVAVLLDLS